MGSVSLVKPTTCCAWQVLCRSWWFPQLETIPLLMEPHSVLGPSSPPWASEKDSLCRSRSRWLSARLPVYPSRQGLHSTWAFDGIQHWGQRGSRKELLVLIERNMQKHSFLLLAIATCGGDPWGCGSRLGTMRGATENRADTVDCRAKCSRNLGPCWHCWASKSTSPETALPLDSSLYEIINILIALVCAVQYGSH